MGQYFRFINLDNPFPVRTAVGGKFGEFFWDIDVLEDMAVMEALSQTKKTVVTIEPYGQLRRPEKRFDILEGRMVFPEESLANTTLPTELVGMILEEIEDLADLVCFVLTCQRYFEIGRPILEARFEEILNYSWAGNRLICAGDNADIDDLPEGMLTEDEKKLLDEKFRPGNTDEDSDDVWEQLISVQTLQPDWHLNQKRTTFISTHRTRIYYYFMDLRRPSYRSAGKRVPPRVGWAGRRDLEVLLELTVDVLPLDLPYRFSEMYRSCVLRNLRALCFMHLLVLRITWSQDPSLNIRYEGPIQVHRGVWAGHRFDFADTKTVEDGQGTIGDWKDVSEVVIEELMAVFEEEAEDMNRYYD